MKTWLCEKCSKKEKAAEKSARERATPFVPGEMEDHPNFKPNKPSRTTLKIWQYNADGIESKMFELRDRMMNAGVDVCAVQETKLATKQKDPQIPGYATLRLDRKNISGGGLLIFVKKDLNFHRVPAYTDHRLGLEVQTIRIFTGRRQWIDLANCYLPNTTNIRLRIT